MDMIIKENWYSSHISEIVKVNRFLSLRVLFLVLVHCDLLGSSVKGYRIEKKPQVMDIFVTTQAFPSTKRENNCNKQCIHFMISKKKRI